jgi:Flp pilus assembly protein TadG
MTTKRMNERGAVAVIVALTFLALAMFGAAAFDIGKAIYVRSVLQSAVDSAMKAAAADAVTQPSDWTRDQIDARSTQVAKDYIRANVRLPASLVRFDLDKQEDFDLNYVMTDAANPGTNNENTISITLNAKVPVSFWRLFIPTIPLTISGRVQRPRPAPVQLVIVADTTESMAESFGTTTKIEALKTAAKSLVTTLMKGDFVRVGLIPFGAYIRLDVNLGYVTRDDVNDTLTSNVPWLNVGADPQIKDCPSTSCKWYDMTCYDDKGKPYTCKSYRCSCPNGVKRPWTWAGGLMGRPNTPPPPERPGQIYPRASIAEPIRFPYFIIASAGAIGVLPVVTDLVIKDNTNRTYTLGTKSYNAEGFLKAKIDQFRAIGKGYMGTYLATGLVWGWNMVTAESIKADDPRAIKDPKLAGKPDPNFPFNSGFTPEDVQRLGVRRAIVFITDGNNTMYAYPRTLDGVNYGDTFDTIYNKPKGDLKGQQDYLISQAASDMAQACENIKEDGVEIYVVALQLGDDRSSTVTYTDKSGRKVSGTYEQLLQDCASSPGAFFATDNPTQLNEAFRRIGAAFSYNTLRE